MKEVWFHLMGLKDPDSGAGFSLQLLLTFNRCITQESASEIKTTLIKQEETEGMQETGSRQNSKKAGNASVCVELRKQRAARGTGLHGADRHPCHNQDDGVRKLFLGPTAVESEASFKAVAFRATPLLLLL